MKKQSVHQPKKVRVSRSTVKKRVSVFFAGPAERSRALLSRRPHRSFRRTRRRDYQRSLQLPGYFSFTMYVLSTLKRQRKTYFGLIIVFSFITMLLANTFSQATFVQLSDVLRDTSAEIFDGNLDQISQAGLLLLSFGGGALSGEVTEAQQLFAFIFFVLIWLTVVWLLRAQLAGGRPRLRDALYSAGSPIVASSLLFILLLVQLVPAALAIIVLNAAYTSDLLGFGLLPFLVAIVSVMLVILSIYLVVSSIFALVIVTLPGMYPWRALRTSGDLVTGRRLRILYRLTWMLFLVLVFWAAMMIPIIMLVTWLQSMLSWLEYIPIVPTSLVLVSTAGATFMAAYVYLLYRKVVDDDASPA